MPQPFTSYVKGQWNRELAYLFAGLQQWDTRAQEWGKKLLYGTKRSDA
jgi:altered-inheritance-of-mitochondria protein 5